MYLFSLVGFFFYDNTYYDGDLGEGGENSCMSVWQCVLTTINFGVRNGGGLADTLIP